jgi:hypothetical protein
MESYSSFRPKKGGRQSFTGQAIEFYRKILPEKAGCPDRPFAVIIRPVFRRRLRGQFAQGTAKDKGISKIISELTHVCRMTVLRLAISSLGIRRRERTMKSAKYPCWGLAY